VDARVECQPDPGSVRQARLFVVDRLQEWGADDVVESAALLTSELATNAVLHTRRPFVVEVLHTGTVVRVEVSDRSEEIPHLPRHLAPSATNGASTGDVLGGDVGAEERLFSGLGMVDAVASRWGAEPRPGEGKVVWFELARAADQEHDGLRALRHLQDEPDPLVAVLPPLEAEGLDDVRRVALLRALAIVVFVALLGVAVYAGLWAGGVLGEVWYGH
jgi:hypothetical protein